MTGICSGNAPSPLWFTFGRVLSLVSWIALIRLTGPDVCSGMVGFVHYLGTVWKLRLVPMLVLTANHLERVAWRRLSGILLLALLSGSEGSLVFDEVSRVGVAAAGVRKCVWRILVSSNVGSP